MQTINRTKAKELIKDSKGLIFNTSFIKKDNTIRPKQIQSCMRL